MNAKPSRQNKVLVLGGYGGNNVGDDAQLAGALMDLRSTLPDATLIVLTPDLKQTVTRHNLAAVGYAPRVSFLDFDEDWQRYAHFGKPAHKQWLIERIEHIRREAGNYARGIPHKLTPKQLTLVSEIQTARLIYYAGGGYMMGPTASRLWDAMLVCQVAKMFEVPVVMSGQNIGVWVRDYDRQCAREGFKTVALIGTRDDTFSRRDLAEVGVTGDRIIATHDDAFFVPNAPSSVARYILKRVGLPQGKPFISLSFHLPDNALDVINLIREVTTLPIVIIPTCPPDQKPQADIFEQAKKLGIPDLYIVRKLHEYAVVKALIAEARLCVSSRHHPIIFALSGSVPCLSMNFSPYFSAKNYGAMKLCGMEEYCIDLQGKHFNQQTNELFGERFAFLQAKRDEISNRITASHTTLKAAKATFMTRVQEIWSKAA